MGARRPRERDSVAAVPAPSLQGRSRHVMAAALRYLTSSHHVWGSSGRAGAAGCQHGSCSPCWEGWGPAAPVPVVSKTSDKLWCHAPAAAYRSMPALIAASDSLILISCCFLPFSVPWRSWEEEAGSGGLLWAGRERFWPPSSRSPCTAPARQRLHPSACVGLPQGRRVPKIPLPAVPWGAWLPGWPGMCRGQAGSLRVSPDGSPGPVPVPHRSWCGQPGVQRLVLGGVLSMQGDNPGA